MKIIKTYNWNRRDFSATLQCEDKNCGSKQENDSCYDDANYYDNVVPKIKCKGCGKNSEDLNTPPETITPKHDPNKVM